VLPPEYYHKFPEGYLRHGCQHFMWINTGCVHTKPTRGKESSYHWRRLWHRPRRSYPIRYGGSHGGHCLSPVRRG
jgi:hypothetical protein